MTAQQLKNSILQMAVQGKLVPQDPNDEPASVLLERIRAEKERLIKEKKIKREKNPSVIFKGADNTPYEKIGDEVRSLVDEVPFDIPDSWEWVRISSIAALVTKGTTPRGGNVAYSDNGIGFLRAENVAGLDRLDLSKLNHIDEATHTGFLKRSILAADDVLITIAGTLGRTAIVKEENLPLNANQAVAIIRLVDSHSVDLRYLVYALNAPAIQDKLTAQKKITAIPNLTLEIISDCLVPIPPLNEQRRIVKHFALFVPQIAEYEGKQTELNALNTGFPEALKKSILQEAVQGKLVPQDPSDEPAEALLERIRAEKQRLIKEGKIKKDKHESVIFRRDNSHYEKLDGVERCIDDELPFEIPENWCWVRFGTALVNRDAERIPLSVAQREKLQKKFDYYGASGVIDKVDRYLFDKPLLLIGEDGANLLLRSKPIAFIASGQYWVNNHAHVIDAVAGVDLRYIALFINAINLAPYVTGTAQPKMNQEKLNSILVPMPPTTEQRRIVSAFEEIAAIIQQF
jgi:type I restriction enzyme S subunit